jgi:hypothetical protein
VVYILSSEGKEPEVYRKTVEYDPEIEGRQLAASFRQVVAAEG